MSGRAARARRVAAGLLLVLGAACSSGRAPFEPRTVAELQLALVRDGLERCGRPISLAPANQAVERQAIAVARDCHEGVATLVVDRFESAEARDAAARAFEAQARPRVDGVLWTWGPFTILVTGPRDDATLDRVADVLDRLGAR